MVLDAYKLISSYLLCLWFLHTPTCHSVYVGRTKYLVVSSPLDAKIVYTKIPGTGFLPGYQQVPENLISAGLTQPMGIAIHHNSNTLYVADAGSRSIYSYILHVYGEELSAGAQTVVLQDVDARWIAVDVIGNLYLTEEVKSQVIKVPSHQMSSVEKAPVVLFDGSKQMVSGPGGIAADNFYLYWVNTANGGDIGSVVMAKTDGDLTSLHLLANNTQTSYGICVVLNNIYFSQPTTHLYAVKKGGGSVTTASRRLSAPKGCAYDGDATVYVGDSLENGVYSFAGNMQTLRESTLSKTVDVHDAFGLAILSSGAHTLLGPLGFISVSLAILSISK